VEKRELLALYFLSTHSTITLTSTRLGAEAVAGKARGTTTGADVLNFFRDSVLQLTTREDEECIF